MLFPAEIRSRVPWLQQANRVHRVLPGEKNGTSPPLSQQLLENQRQPGHSPQDGMSSKDGGSVELPPDRAGWPLLPVAANLEQKTSTGHGC